ncbi:MAG: hypothetical protein IJ324_02200 [Lachnospiraceae bacterium]|nr:hypothetical protein [Lachnospiraceae bacterium]
MGRNRGTAGKSYEVTYPAPGEAAVTYTYRCPYCGEDTTVEKVYSAGLDILEKGMFYEPLACGHCGEVADVRYLPHKRVW